MLRLKRFILPVVVAILAAFAVGDFFAAPLTTAGYLKNKLGLVLVKRDIRQTYDQAVRLAESTSDTLAGTNAVRTLCQHPIEKLGFYYTCSIGWAAELPGADGHDVAYDFIIIESFVSENEANDATFGRVDYDVRYRGDPYYTGESPKRVDRRGLTLASMEMGHRPVFDR